MNLNKLFPLQKQLDEHIVKEKGLEGQDLLDKKILALQVELGELANEFRGFKFWSENQEPNVLSYKCSECGFTRKENIDCPLADEHYEFYMIGFNPLLEEYVDCLHFILSIGNDLGEFEYEPKEHFQSIVEPVEAFNFLFDAITLMWRSIEHKKSKGNRMSLAIYNYKLLLSIFI